ncbi:MAG: DivIVA domain-containing protein, partial [Fidelibacterota bacterium]
MKITPLDIRKHEFKKSVRGYDRDEVDYFLELISEEYENLLRKKNELEKRVREMQKQIEEYKQVEKSLQETLISAKETSDRSLQNSKKEAELIINDAELKADKIIEEARRKASIIESEITRLKVQKDAFTIRLKNILKSQLELVEMMDEEEVDEIEEAKTADEES